MPSKFDEDQWIIQLRKTLDEQIEDSTEMPVSIFSVPKTLLTCDPDSYVPQQVPIGPYHYWRPEMYEMERYKIAAAKRMEKHLGDLKFEDVVHQLSKYEPQIRACYHKYLTCNGEALAWIMAIDSCFMLEFLQIYAPKDGKQLNRISSRMSHLLDVTGKKAAHNANIRDMMMLENQIPLFILRKMLETKFSSLEKADNVLFEMLMGFARVLCPFKKIEDLSEAKAMECSHLLDVLYHMTVPKLEPRGPRHHPSFEITNPHEHAESRESSEERSSCCKFLDQIWKILKKITAGPLRVIRKILASRVVEFLKKLPSMIISNIPGIKIFKGPLEDIFLKDEENSGEDPDEDKPPLVEEIKIPSVSLLSEASVNFVPTDEGILSINFDSKTCTFYLPSISLDENSVVIMKNLVAYEACHASGPVIFTRYTELMNGIIDTEEDAKFLREKGIIRNRLKSDEEVVKLWNGMSRSVRLTKAPKLDKVIIDVNKFYSARWKVKLRNFVKRYVFGSWQFLTLLGCLAILLLMFFQAFCDVYSCRRIFKIDILQGSEVSLPH